MAEEVTDIPQKLRDLACGGSNWNGVLTRAADAIESRDATIAELRAQVEALKPDAERYRWLRSVGGKTWHHIERDCLAIDGFYDAAIDAARSQESAR